MVKPKGFMRMNCTESIGSKPISGNSILMLSLVSESTKKAWLGITKLQKLTFLTEYYLSQESKRGFGYRFFMYDHGPISKGVYNDFELLLDQQLIIDDEAGIQVSKAGNNINDQLKNLIPPEIAAVMQEIVSKFAHMKTHEIVNFVHNMVIKLPSGDTVRIHDVEKGCIVLPESENTFKVDKSYIETFKILADESLREAIRAERKKGSVSYPYQPLS
jgi:uncharacterized protein YwgA